MLKSRPGLVAVLAIMIAIVFAVATFVLALSGGPS